MPVNSVAFINMNETTISEYITNTFSGVETSTAYGYTFFFYSSDHLRPFATLISADNEYDRISDLDRPGVYRLNIGVGRKTFESLFGSGKVDVAGYDYAALDVIMPHPEYAAQHFICVLSPGAATLERTKALLTEAYEIAVRRFNRRNKQK